MAPLVSLSPSPGPSCGNLSQPFHWEWEEPRKRTPTMSQHPCQRDVSASTAPLQSEALASSLSPPLGRLASWKGLQEEGGRAGRTPNCCWWWSGAPPCSESQQSPRGSPELRLQKQVSGRSSEQEPLENPEWLQAENQMFGTEHSPALLRGAAEENTTPFSLFPQAKHEQCRFSRARPPRPVMEGLRLPPVT